MMVVDALNADVLFYFKILSLDGLRDGFLGAALMKRVFGLTRWFV